MTMSQPIIKYSKVEKISNFPVKNNFKTVPKSAIPQTAKNKGQPKLSLSKISNTGVYVPAINK